MPCFSKWGCCFRLKFYFLFLQRCKIDLDNYLAGYFNIRQYLGQYLLCRTRYFCYLYYSQSSFWPNVR